MKVFLLECPVCKRECVVRTDKYDRPYIKCGNCGTVVFFRSEKGINFVREKGVERDVKYIF